jgi:SAM-dependent methyltransferase
VLDAGSGEAPYRGLFDAVTYHTADFAQVDKRYGQIDYVCDLSDIPVPDATYDLVVATQVLEHIPEPGRVLAEFHRVLKPGGQAWLSAPLFYEEHEKPYDFHRYTQFAWQRMADQAGFVSVEVDWLEGYFGTLSYQAWMAAGQLPGRWMPWRILLAILARQAARAELRNKVTDIGMPKNYCCVMVKA